MTDQPYVPGSHAAGVRASRDAERTRLLARQDVVAAERDARQAEMDDIAEALALLSEPSKLEAFEGNVTSLNRQGAAE